MQRCGKHEDPETHLSKSPLQSARTGMVKGCHTGFNVLFTTSVLWQIVNLEEKEKLGKDKATIMAYGTEHGVKQAAGKTMATVRTAA